MTTPMPFLVFHHTKHRKDRLGGIIPLVAVVLLALLVVGGVAIDSARLQLVKSELRSAADNVARSAANQMVLTGSTSAARSKAIEVAALYQVGNQSFSLSENDIEFGRATVANGQTAFVANATPPNAVRVNASRSSGSAAGTVAMLFGKMFGVSTAEVSSEAVAGFRIVDICMVLDRSTSMKLGIHEANLGLTSLDPRFMAAPNADSRWLALDHAVSDFIFSLKQNQAEEQVAMVTYASDFSFFPFYWPASTINLGLTVNLDACTTEMTNLSSSVWNGNTYIEAGMRDGLTTLLNDPNARSSAEKVMIVFTDGIQNQGECRNAAIDAAAQNVTIHTITFSDHADQTTMAEVASIGHGNHAHANDEATLTAIMQSIVAELSSIID